MYNAGQRISVCMRMEVLTAVGVYLNYPFSTESAIVLGSVYVLEFLVVIFQPFASSEGLQELHIFIAFKGNIVLRKQ